MKLKPMTKLIIYFLVLVLFPWQSNATIYDLSTLLPSNKAAFQIEGSAVSDEFGWQIANAGDFNGDGFQDIIIGTQVQTSSYGKVYVVYGKAGFSFTDLDVTNLDPASTGFKITGPVKGDSFGNSVGGAGDINKDGYADIIIGAAGASSNRGAVYVIYGKPNPANIALASTSLVPAQTGFVITGKDSVDQLGWTVAPAGDVNKDGYDDMIIGAPYGNLNRGVAYVVYGRATASFVNINLASTTLNPALTGFTIKGAANGDFFGNSVSTAGDINKDGYADIIIGANLKNSQRGTVYVIYGGSTSSRVNIDLSSGTALAPASTGFFVAGKSSGENFGVVVNTAGDINNDGYDDMVIGAAARNSNRGAAQVIYGGPNSGFSDIDLSLTGAALNPTSKGFVISGNAVSDSLGSAVAPAGDINSDGYDDIIVTAVGKNSNKGAVYVVYGGATSTRVDIDLQSKELDPLVDGFAVTGVLPSGQFGFSADKIDLNKDGKEELLVGAPDATSSTGVSYVIFPGKICSANCASCSKIATCDTCNPAYGLENSACVTCAQGKYPNNGGPCATCPTGCAQCTSNTACTSCSTGYYLPTGTNVLCTVCPMGCTQCSSSTVCSGCLAGYYQSSYTCQSCPGGCSACSSSSVCSSCLTGYSLSGSRCCPDKCSACTDYQTCTACKPGYGLLSGQCGVCPSRTVLSNGNCASCPNHCSECASSTSCSACDSGYGLLNSLCVICPAGTYLVLGKCESCLSSCSTCTDASTCATCPTGKLLYMSQCIDSCPDKTFLSLSGPYCEDCPGECSKCTSSSICTACEVGYLFAQPKCIPCPDGTYLVSGKCESCSVGCLKCSSDSVCQQCKDGYTLSTSYSCDVDPQEEAPVKTREKAAGNTFDGASIAGAALASGSSLPVNFGLVAKILRNLKHLNVTVSIELQETFYSWKVNSGFLKAPKSWSSESSSRPLPGVFRRYGLDPVFLINYWKPLILTMAGFVLFVAFKVMEIGLNKGGEKQHGSIPRQLNVAASNFALTQIYSTLDDVIFYFVLDVRSTEFDGAFRGFSFALAVVLILIGGLALGFHGLLLQKYQSLKGDKGKLQGFLYEYENMKLIFEDFKDTTLATQSFLWIHLMRALISSLLFVTLFEYPLIQTLILLVSNLGIIIFIFVKGPFKEILSACSQIFCEVVLLLANICMLVMAILDQAGSENIDAIKHLSRGVIILNAILLFGSAIFMVVGTLKSLWNLYQARKKPRQAVPPQIKDSRRINKNADRFNSTAVNINQSNQWQQTDNFAPRHNDSNFLDLKNQYEISDLSCDMNGGNLNESHFNSLPSNYQGYQDETLMNTSNANIVRHNSLRPKVLGKIKMPGGVEINPRSSNGGSPILEYQSPPLLYQNPRNVGNRSPAGFGSQLKSSAEANNPQKRNTDRYEEFILERTRGRMKYHQTRKNNS